MDSIVAVSTAATQQWAGLHKDILERIGLELPFRDLLNARLVCAHWRAHVSAAVRCLPHGLLELDAQPRLEPWTHTLRHVAACLPSLAELMTYVSSRVPQEELTHQLHSLSTFLPQLRKLELRFVVPTSAPHLGSTLAQLQPALSALTGLHTLYLVMGSSPEPAELAHVLSGLPDLRDLKLLSGLPQYGLTDNKLRALGSLGAAGALGQLTSLHVEVSGVRPVAGGLAALGRLAALRVVQLDGVVRPGEGVLGALGRLTGLEELRLELDSPQHLPDLFLLPTLRRLRLAYHGEDYALDLDDDDDDDPGLDQPHPGPGAAVGALAAQDAAGGGGGAGAQGGARGGGSSDWLALELLVRGHAARPVVSELALNRCKFPSDPLPLIATLGSTLTTLSLYDCRWRAVVPRAGAGAAVQPVQLRGADGVGAGSSGAGGARGTAALPSPPGTTTWALLASLTCLKSFSMVQCEAPSLSEADLVVLGGANTASGIYGRSSSSSGGGGGGGTARVSSSELSNSCSFPWRDVTSLSLQAALPPPRHVPAAQLQQQLVHACVQPQPQLPSQGSVAPNDATPRTSPPPLRTPAPFRSFMCRWRRLESLTLSGSWCNDPRNTVDAALLPPSLTSLVLSSVTLVCSEARLVAAEAVAAAAGGLTPAIAGLGRAPHVAAAEADGRCEGGARRVQPSGSGCGGRGGDAAAGAEASRAGEGQASGSGSTPGSREHQDGAADVGTSSCGWRWQLPSLEHLVLEEVALGQGVTLGSVAAAVPHLRSLEINNLTPSLTDGSVGALAALTGLTVLRVSQDQEGEGEWDGDADGEEPGQQEQQGGASPGEKQPLLGHGSESSSDDGHGGDALGGGGVWEGDMGQLGAAGAAGLGAAVRRPLLTARGLTALTALRQLRQLEWLPWGCEPLDERHVSEGLAALRRLHVVTLRGARDVGVRPGAMVALREALPLVDVDDTEWAGLVDV